MTNSGDVQASSARIKESPVNNNTRPILADSVQEEVSKSWLEIEIPCAVYLVDEEGLTRHDLPLETFHEATPCASLHLQVASHKVESSWFYSYVALLETNADHLQLHAALVGKEEIPGTPDIC